MISVRTIGGFLNVVLSPEQLTCIVIENKGYKSVTQNSSYRSSPPSNTTADEPITPPPPKISIRVGDAVSHKAFGLGVIKKIDGKYFTVQFDHDSKDFICPDVFESGLMEDFNLKKRNNL